MTPSDVAQRILNSGNSVLFPEPTRRVAIKEYASAGALQASPDHGALSYSLNSLSVTAAKIECHLSISSELSELDMLF